MADFNQAYAKTLVLEGGYVNHPNDRGGETYMGIARKMHPRWEGWKIIDELKKKRSFSRGDMIDDDLLNKMVKTFYREKYWNAANLDQVNDQGVADRVYDAGVNMGLGTSVKFLQEALNLLNRNQKDYKDMPVDGGCGPLTLGVLNCHKRTEALIRTMDGLRFMRYVEICRRDPSQEVFFIGWLNRIYYGTE